MAAASVRYTGDSFIRLMEREFKNRLVKIGEMLASTVRKNISVSTRANGPSTEGEFPHADSGRLRASVSYRVDGPTAEPRVTVGTPLFYGGILEYHRDRSFLHRTAQEMRGNIQRILVAPVGSGRASPGGTITIEDF